jgi:hypothetical protein
LLWGFDMPVLSQARQASNHARILNRLAIQVEAMSADWGDLDNYFLNQLSDISGRLRDAADELKEYVTESAGDKTTE